MITRYGIEPLRALLREDAERRVVSTISAKRFSSLYTISFKLCSQPQFPDYSQQLYFRVKNTVELILRNDLIPPLIKRNGVVFLKEFCNAWRSHKIIVAWMFKLFMHLDRGIVINHELPSITSCCLRAFYEVIFCSVKEQVRDTIIDIYRQDREDSSNSDIVAECTRIFEAMGMASQTFHLKNFGEIQTSPSIMTVYEKELEGYLISETSSYYSAWGFNLLSSTNSIFSYLLRIEEMIIKETTLCERYFHRQTIEKSRLTCVQTLVVSHSDTICEGLMVSFVDFASQLSSFFRLEDSIDHDSALSLLSPTRFVYTLFQEIFSISSLSHVGQHLMISLSTEFYRFAMKLGESLRSLSSKSIQQVSNSSTQRMTKEISINYVKRLIELLLMLGEVCSRIFEGHTLFLQSMKKITHHLVNSEIEGLNVVEVYTQYCQYCFAGDTTLDKLEQFMKRIFSYLENKDLFLDSYQRLFAKRILSGNLSMDTERSMISWMKIECGVSFTVKLEGMLNDHILSKDIFRSWRLTSNSSPLPIDFSVQVLTSCFWPKLLETSLELPPEMKCCQESFSRWYVNMNSSRIVKWNYSLGEVIVRASYFRQSAEKMIDTYDIVLTPEQAVVLKAFDNFAETNSGYSIAFLQKYLGIDIKTLKRVLHSLSSQNQKVLEKSPGEPKLTDTDVFLPNIKFFSKQKKEQFKLLMPTIEEPKVSKNIEIERALILDTTIVRIMKARKIMTHKNLQSEILQQISHFHPEMKFIKGRISILIEKGYLERDQFDTHCYRYLP